ncbi:MAG: nuclear transport factor 2 family protein [Solirubrobacterales bacterium]
MSEESLEVVRRWWASFNEHGMPALDLCDEQIEIRNPPDFPVRGSYHGHEGVRQWRTDVFEVVDDANVEVEKLIDAGDGKTVVMFLRLQGMAIYTRIQFDEPWAAVWRIEGGKLLHAQGYTSRRKALEAAGLHE